MKAFIYKAALYCEACGEKIRKQLTRKGKAPANPADEHTYDSDDFPKGPYDDAGGEADCFQHCDDCGCFLKNPLTSDGVEHATEALRDYIDRASGGAEVLDEWAAELGDYSLSADDKATLDAYNAKREAEGR